MGEVHATMVGMRRHLTWIILLVLAPVLYVLSMLAVAAAGDLAAESGDSGAAIGWAFAQLGMLLVAVAAPVTLIILSVVHMRRTFRRAQRARGRFTRAEQATLAQAQRSAEAWEHARAVRSALLARRVPGEISQWNVVPYEGETFFAEVPLTYARYYGQDVAYQQGSTLAVGSPGFVVGALAVTAMSNAAARSRAAAASVPQWREWQVSQVYLTNRRIVAGVGGRWLSFDYSAMTAVYPELGSATLVCQFDSAEPLLLSGDAAALAAVLAVMQTRGPDGVRDHPGLQLLNVSAPEPSLPPVGKAR